MPHTAPLSITSYQEKSNSHYSRTWIVDTCWLWRRRNFQRQE